MATAKALEISEEVVETIAEKIASALENPTVDVSFPIPVLLGGMGVAAGAGVAGYFLAKLIDGKLNKAQREEEMECQAWEIADRVHYLLDPPAAYNDEEEPDPLRASHQTWQNFKESDEEQHSGRYPWGAGKLILPEELEKDEYFETLEEAGYVRASEMTAANPSIEIAESYDEFEGSIDGYSQKVAVYVAKSDIALEFDEEQDKFVKIDDEAVLMAAKVLMSEENHAFEIFAADHTAEVVYEVDLDEDHDLQEVLEDVGQQEL